MKLEMKKTDAPSDEGLLRLTGTVSLILVFCMVFIMGLIKLSTPDIGFHLQSAKWMLENKAFIYHDSFTYTSAGNPYYNLQWIYQLGMYALHEMGGIPLLVVVNAMLILTACILVWIRYKNDYGTRVTSVLGFTLALLLAAQPLSYQVRPHVMSWIFLNCTLLLLEGYRRKGKGPLYILPVIILVWVNTHSLAILGPAVLMIYLAGIYLETGKADRKLAWVTALCFFTFLINPYFFEGLLYPFQQFLSISGSNLKQTYISEMQHPFSADEIRRLGLSYFSNPLFLLHIYAAVCAGAIIRRLRTKEYTQALLLLSFLYLLVLAVKNYGFFVMVSLPAAAGYISTFFQGKGNTSVKPVPVPVNVEPVMARRTAFWQGIGISVSLIILITSITDGYPIFRTSPYRFGTGIDEDQLPVGACRFIRDNQLGGRILNHLDFGGYLMYATGSKVFIDGRMEVISGDFFETYQRSLVRRKGLQELLLKYDPDMVLFPYVKAYGWWEYFIDKRTQTDYKPVYVDGLSVLYCKRSKYAGLPELDEERLTGGTVPESLQGLMAMVQEYHRPGRAGILFRGLFKKQVYALADERLATYAFTCGYKKAGLLFSARCIRQSTIHVPHVLRNLERFFSDEGMINEAQLCSEKAE